MQRFSSLKYAPAEARRILRDRFARYLPTQHNTVTHAPKQFILPDEALLRLLLNLNIDFESDIARARATYTAALPQNSSEPTLEELIETGWFRVVWGRLSPSFEMAHAARSAPPGTMTAFAALQATRYEQVFRLADAVRSDADLITVAGAVERAELRPDNIGSQTPEWVAARLWDRSLTEFVNPSDALRVWVDRWRQLGCPSLVPGQAWNERDANVFRDAAMTVLAFEPSLTGWNETRAIFIKQIATAGRQPEANIEKYIPPVPATLVDRVLWLDSRALERAVIGTLRDHDDIFGLVRLLLADVEAQDHGPVPHSIIGRLLALATERPELFLIVIFKARWISVLIADLLLNPTTSALACLLIAQWRSLPGSWERELRSRDDLTTKATAFTDAVSVLVDYLEQGSVDPREAASLLVWFHQTAQPGFVDDLTGNELMLSTLRREFAGLPSKTLQVMITALFGSMPESGLGTPAFAAALDIAESGKLVNEIDPTPLIAAYTRSVAAGDYSLSAHRVSVSSAASLFDLVPGTRPELRREFLCPLDVRAKRAAGTAAAENPVSVEDAIARSIRAHIRILSRAAAGRAEAVPDDLADALVAAVRAGALTHEEKGRVAAFSADHESDTFRGNLDRPIAADLGAALTAFVDDHREKLLTAILETDEPAVLAQLLSFVPYTARDRIRQRILYLTPSEAGSVHSLTARQARIDALLSAGVTDAAARFIDLERDFKVRVPGQDMMRLRDTLRLHLLRGEWDAITNFSLPEPTAYVGQATEAETIIFYKGLVELNRPGGNRNEAEQMFAQLQGRHTEVAAYVINLFAARINLLLGNDLFGQLRGAAFVRGRQVLAEAEQMILHARAVGTSESEIFDCNKALLLLALGQPERANELLIPLRAERLGDGIAAYTAIALARTGRAPEAIAALGRAGQEFGDTGVLRAALEHIESGKPYAAVANVSLDDDPRRRIMDALWHFSRMNPIQQAEVWQPPEKGALTSWDRFERLAIDSVQQAASRMTLLVPMMKAKKTNYSEDDLSSFIRELLSAGVQFLGWSVRDHSKAGYTPKRNPGEPDLLLLKDGTVLAAIEAVVCKESVPYQKLTQHFQKLLAYADCRLYFHLTYVYGADSAPILDHLKCAAKHDAPARYVYHDHKDIIFTDSRPKGFIARYAADSDSVTVAFLVINVGQVRQIEAAITAGTSKPRRRRTPDNPAQNS